jgi:hypothetical protein
MAPKSEYAELVIWRDGSLVRRDPRVTMSRYPGALNDRDDVVVYTSDATLGGVTPVLSAHGPTHQYEGLGIGSAPACQTLIAHGADLVRVGGGRELTDVTGLALNNARAVVGVALAPSREGAVTGFLWHDGYAIDLSTHLASSQVARILMAEAINDRWQIAGVGELDGESADVLRRRRQALVLLTPTTRVPRR